jgi:hypothetical protein
VVENAVLIAKIAKGEIEAVPEDDGILNDALEAAGVEFVDGNEEGVGVRLSE